MKATNKKALLLNTALLTPVFRISIAKDLETLNKSVAFLVLSFSLLSNERLEQDAF